MKNAVKEEITVEELPKIQTTTVNKYKQQRNDPKEVVEEAKCKT